MTLTNQNFIQEEIPSKLNFGNACYNAVKNPLSSHFLSKSAKIKTRKSDTLHWVR